MNKPIRILLVDDQPSVRRGLRMRLGLEPDILVVGEACDGEEALITCANVEPDVIIMDVEMPVMDGITATNLLATAAPTCAVVILSLHDDIYTRERAHIAGAADFVAKHEMDQALTDAIRSAAGRKS